MIFDGRAAQRQAMRAAQEPHRFGRFGTGVFDGLRFVEHHVIELDILDCDGVAAQRAISGQDDIVIREAVAYRAPARCGRARAAAA